MRSNKGQGWTLDYVVSLMIFLLAGILVVKILTNTFVTDDFLDVKKDGIRVSEHLLNTGVPEDWNSENVILLGLTSSKNRISEPKAENFLNLDYNLTKNRLGIRHDYAFFFEDGNGSIISVLSECGLGSVDMPESKNLYPEMRPAAYYFKDESFLGGWMTTLGATFYDGNQADEVDGFYNNLSNYRFVAMENPLMQLGGTLSDIEKREALDTYVANGGVLFISENISLNISGVGGFSLVDFHADVLDGDDYWDITGGNTITDNDIADPSFSVVDMNSSNFEILADYQVTGDPWLAKWNYGVGQVYFIATINSQYSGGGGYVLQDKAGPAARTYVNITRANCTGFNSIDSENIARIERLAVMNSEIIKLVVIAWS